MTNSTDHAGCYFTCNEITDSDEGRFATVACRNGKFACCRLSLQIEPPKGAECATGECSVESGRLLSGTQLYIRAESAPCMKAHSFCGSAGSGLRPLHRKSKAATAE